MAILLNQSGRLPLTLAINELQLANQAKINLRQALPDLRSMILYVDSSMLTEHEIQFRVRYKETDAMGYLHHANYAVYFEMGRTELLRAQGGNYRAMEEAGLFMVVVRLNTHFRAPARYDDFLTLKTRIKRVGAAKLEHEYFLYRDGLLLSQGDSVLACVDSAGKVQPIPDALRGDIET